MHAKPKKSLGQNFLIDGNIQRKIISCAGFIPCDNVLEIGAGRGELSASIAQVVSHLFALEIDANLCGKLRQALRNCPNTVIINKDILKFNLESYFSKTENKIKVLGNIPYYISSPIIEHLFKFKNKIETIFLTVQKEFGRRVVASAGSKEYGAFSCFVQYYTEPKILFNIKKNSFYPAPKVDSCFLRLHMRKQPAVEIRDEAFFFKVIRASFNKRRKTLRNSLSGIIADEKLRLFFRSNKINPDIRPEMLALPDFAKLANS